MNLFDDITLFRIRISEVSTLDFIPNLCKLEPHTEAFSPSLPVFTNKNMPSVPIDHGKPKCFLFILYKKYEKLFTLCDSERSSFSKSGE